MTNRRLPSLNAVRTFEAAAKLLSFTKAAEELCVTQSAVSRMIHSLEEELGVVLFHRNGRILSLTQAGAHYYAEITEALNRIALATLRLKDTKVSSLLSVSVLPTFALRWLVPRLHRFQALHPDILVDITTSEHLVDFRVESVDIGIRYGTGVWPNTEAMLLMNEDMGVFCSPTLLLRENSFTQPADLIQHQLLQHTTRPQAWLEYFEAFGLIGIQPSISGNFEHFFMVIEAAVAGMGIALLPLFLAQPEVTSGRLIQPLPQTVRKKQAYYVAHAINGEKKHKIRVFKEWLKNEAQKPF